MDFNSLSFRCGDLFPGIIGANGEFPVTAIYEDSELNRPGTSEIDDGVQRRPDSSPGVKDIINQHNHLIYEIEQDFGFLNQRLVELDLEIVAVEGDVDYADRHVGVTNPIQDFFTMSENTAKRAARIMQIAMNPIRPATGA